MDVTAVAAGAAVAATAAAPPLPQEGPPPRPDRVPARVTVVQTVYHEFPGAETAPHESRYSVVVGSGEQAFSRVYVVGTDWAPLERGWLERASELVLENAEGRVRQLTPSPAELAAEAARVVELGVLADEAAAPPKPGRRTMWDAPAQPAPRVVTVLTVRPGRSARLQPAELGRLYVRCRAGTARVQVFAVPD